MSIILYRPTGGIERDERRGDQASEEEGHVETVWASASAECLGGLEAPPRFEHRETAEEALGVWREEVITPANRRIEAAVPACHPIGRRRCAARPEPVRHTIEREVGDERRGELDTQR